MFDKTTTVSITWLEQFANNQNFRSSFCSQKWNILLFAPDSQTLVKDCNMVKRDRFVGKPIENKVGSQDFAYSEGVRLQPTLNNSIEICQPE